MYLICGEALYDLFLTDEQGPGALTFDARIGGSPLNVAIGVARQGGRSALLTGVSDDLLGRRLETVLRQEGVDTSYLQRSGRRTTLSIVDLSAEGHPEYAFYGVGSADTALEPGDVPTLGADITGLHFGSYSIAKPPVADAFAALAAARADLFISLDPNVRPTVEPDLAIWRRRIDAFLPKADLVKASVEDLGMLYDGAAPADIAARWLAAGVTLVVFTDGGDRVTAYAHDRRVETPPPPCEVVDTVGAGDAFQAALLAGLAADGADPKAQLGALTDGTLGALLADAAAVAAETCARRGADIPRRLPT